MKRLNILIICPFFRPNLGGVETHLDYLTKYLIREGHKVTVLTYKPLTVSVAYLPYEKEGNLEIRRFWWFGTIRWFDATTPYPFLQYLYIVPGLLFNCLVFMIKNRQRYDVIHAHGFTAAFVTRIIDFFFPGKRLVVSTHFIYRRLKPGNVYSRIFSWVLKKFDIILSVGEESSRELEAIGVSSLKIKPYFHWIDQNKFVAKNKLKCRAQLGLPLKERLIVLFVGRIVRMKGVFLVLDVARHLSRQAFFVFLGDGPDFTALKKKGKGLRNVKILGRKSQSEVADYFGACDFLLLPSLAEEGQPLVVMEALTSGRPVVTTNRGAIIDMFDNSVGIKITPSRENIKKTIADLFNHLQKLKKMTESARKYALERFSEKNAKIITSSYYD